MCLRYPPTIVACVCIHLACKWSKYEIPVSAQNRPWYSYVDPNANIDQIERLTREFLTILSLSYGARILSLAEHVGFCHSRRGSLGACPVITFSPIDPH